MSEITIAKLLGSLLSIVLLIMAVFALDAPKGSSDSTEEPITILFTHDLHDSFLPFEVERGLEKMTVGRCARLHSAIVEQREKDRDALLVNAGDFAM